MRRRQPFLLVVEATQRVALPGGLMAHVITEAVWLNFSLVRCLETHPSVIYPLNPSPFLPIKKKYKKKKHERDFGQPPDWPVAGCHYYCDGADLTQPFPYVRGPRAHHAWQSEFCANESWCRPFVANGLADWCSLLIRGTLSPFLSSARSPEVPGTASGKVLRAVVLSRHSLHGVRAGVHSNYRLDAGACAGANDVESELLMWAPTAEIALPNLPAEPDAVSGSPPASGMAAFELPATDSAICSYIWRTSTTLAQVFFVPFHSLQAEREREGEREREREREKKKNKRN